MGWIIMDINIERSLKTAMRTGSVLTGANETIKAVKSGDAQLVVIASNTPERIRKEVQSGSAPIFEYPGTNVQLGPATGVPYIVSVLAVIDPGESDILALKRGAEVE